METSVASYDARQRQERGSSNRTQRRRTERARAPDPQRRMKRRCNAADRSRTSSSSAGLTPACARGSSTSSSSASDHNSGCGAPVRGSSGRPLQGGARAHVNVRGGRVRHAVGGALGRGGGGGGGDPSGLPGVLMGGGGGGGGGLSGDRFGRLVWQRYRGAIAAEAAALRRRCGGPVPSECAVSSAVRICLGDGLWPRVRCGRPWSRRLHICSRRHAMGYLWVSYSTQRYSSVP
jgi:hypothetical protein